MGWYGHPDGPTEKVHNPTSPWKNIVPIKLNSCPKCGARQKDRMVAYTYFGFKLGEDGWKAFCRNCWASTAFCGTMEEAVKKWNEGDVK